MLQSRIDELQKHWDSADAELNALTETAKPLNAKLRQLEQDIKDQESRVSICRRESKATGAVQTEADRAALAQAEQAVEDTREVVKLVQAEADATRIHQTIIRYTEIARALGPEGVRSKMLADGMRKLNGGLVVIASASGWPLTTVGEGTCAVFVGDRPVALCSESERWRLPSGDPDDPRRNHWQQGGGAGPGRHTGRQQPRWVGQGGAARFRKDSDGGIALQYGHAATRRAVATGCYRKRVVTV